MVRPTGGVGQQSALWLLFVRRLRRCLRLRYLLTMCIFVVIGSYLRLINNVPFDESNNPRSKSDVIDGQPPAVEVPVNNEDLISAKCHFESIDNLLRNFMLTHQQNLSEVNDDRPRPTIERLHSLFSILISHENKFRNIFNLLGIFRFTDIPNSFQPFANNTERLKEIFCLFQRYITISDNGHIDITPSLISYLQQVSTYLSAGFNQHHSTWNNTTVQKPVIILSANARFYDTLQASMRTVNQYLNDYQVVIYDLGFDGKQLNMIKDNCPRCTVIPFPFSQIESVAPHIRHLPNFAWKPVIVQDAVRRFGSIIYGDTSVRYQTSNFDRLLIDNLIRGFSCRELPSHYLSCFTLSGTFSWFNETYSSFDNIYIAEAGFVAVTDNFLSRLILKTWVTCALDVNCISPSNTRTQCKRVGSPTTTTHRYDQSAMVTVLTFFFFQSIRQGEHTDPAPYDMFSSIQKKIAEVKRFEGDGSYFTHRHLANLKQNSSMNTTIALVQSH